MPQSTKREFLYIGNQTHKGALISGGKYILTLARIHLHTCEDMTGRQVMFPTGKKRVFSHKKQVLSKSYQSQRSPDMWLQNTKFISEYFLANLQYLFV